MKRTLLLLGVLAAAAILARPVLAHHGGAAFDQTQSLTMVGTVTELQFANPHVLVYWDSTDEAGATVRWSGWLTAPNKLARAGWTKRTLSPGDQITVSGTPHKGGSHILQVRKLVAPDGRELPLSEN
jgi:hypothetical protein